jgi:hypothetical protein
MNCKRSENSSSSSRYATINCYSIAKLRALVEERVSLGREECVERKAPVEKGENELDSEKISHRVSLSGSRWQLIYEHSTSSLFGT